MHKNISDKINLISSLDNTREFESSITNISKLLNNNSFDELNSEFSIENDYRNKLKLYSIIFTYKRRQNDINFCIKFYHENKIYFQDSFIVKHMYSILLKKLEK